MQELDRVIFRGNALRLEIGITRAVKLDGVQRDLGGAGQAMMGDFVRASAAR